MSLAGRWKPHRRGYSIDQQKRPQSLCPWKICANTHSLFRPDRRHQSQCHNFLPTAARLLCSDRTSVEQSGRHGFLATGPSKKQAKVIVQRVSSGGATRLTFRHLAQATCMARLQLCSPPPSGRFSASSLDAEERANGCWLNG